MNRQDEDTASIVLAASLSNRLKRSSILLKGKHMKIKPGMRRWISATVIGMLATAGLHAQEAPAGKPRAFYISEFVVTDREGIKPYSAQVESTFLPFGGRYIVRGGKISTLEGDGPKGGMVVIEFDSKEQAQAWYDSSAYRKIMPIRHKSATSRVYIVEGTVVPPAH
jgi:uncharacterized protein (DUF1330 family)